MKDQIIQKFVDYLEETHDFALKQMPEIIMEALRYEKISCYFTASLMVCLIATALTFGYHFWKHPALDKYGSREFLSFMVPLFTIITTPMFFVQLCISIDKLIKIYFAPKYFLIQLFLDMKK